MLERHSHAALFNLGLADYSNYVKGKIFQSNLPFSVLEDLQCSLKDDPTLFLLLLRLLKDPMLYCFT